MTNILVRETSPEEVTVRLAATGDEVAFARLVTEHHAAMSRVAHVICGDRETGRDAVQAAWAAAWRRLPALRDPSQVRAWLVAIAANESRQALRRQRRRPIVEIPAEVAEAAGDPAQRVTVLDLRLVLRSLRPDDRALLAMRYAAGLESAEIGQQLGLSASGVRSRIARLLDRLRVDLDESAETNR